MLEAVIFDMDGLLIDSEPFWRQAHREAVKKYGHDVSEDEVRAMAGRKTIDIAQHWIDQFNLDMDAQALCDEIVSRAIHLIERDGTALPGAREVMQMFADRDIPMAIASSATPDVIEVVMERLKLHQYILLAHSAAHEPKGKPDPGVFLTTAKKLGVNPPGCLVFEDALSGIRAAKAAGMKCIAIPEPINFRKQEFKDEADLTLPSLQNVTWNTIAALFV